MILPGIWENSKYMKVNLSVPKFDVSGQQNLAGGLQKLGITEVFSPDNADFSGITADVPVFLTAANQAVRVQIDEQGVKAAAYIELPGATSPAPPEEIIDFVLDRPFLFVITRNDIPLFAGAVNEP
jgi:serine protease inhibitor